MKLDEFYTLKGKKYNWELIYNEPTGEINPETNKEIVKTDKWYFPKLEQVLHRYIEEAVKPLDDAQLILKKLQEIDETIQNIKINNNL